MILFSTDFDTSGEYSAYVVVSGEATHTHLPTGGWDGGGAAKFTPIVANGNNIGIRPVDFTDQDSLFVRFIYKFGSTWHVAVPGTNKLILINRSTGANGDRAMWLCQQSSLQGPPISAIVHHGYLSNNIDRSPPNPVIVNLQPYIDGGLWVCFEQQVSISGNYQKMYMTNQAGTLNNTLVDSISLSGTSGLWSGIDIIGGYHQATGTVDANSYFILDSMVIADQAIGPPAGFVTSGASSSTSWPTSGRGFYGIQ